MGYRVVTVNPLKPFPIASLRLANVVGLDDAKKQIAEKIKKDWETREKEIALLEERWPKIEPALKLHLARQERRLAHFKESCRLAGCDNPRRQNRGRGGERGTKARRPGVKSLFCGSHVGLRKCVTQAMLDELHASSAKRLAVA